MCIFSLFFSAGAARLSTFALRELIDFNFLTREFSPKALFSGSRHPTTPPPFHPLDSANLNLLLRVALYIYFIYMQHMSVPETIRKVAKQM